MRLRAMRLVPHRLIVVSEEEKTNPDPTRQCTTAALTAINPLESQYPDAKWFGGHFRKATSWSAVKTDISTRCAAIASKISSRGPMITKAPLKKVKSGRSA